MKQYFTIILATLAVCWSAAWADESTQPTTSGVSIDSLRQQAQSSSVSVSDARQRLEILKWIEEYRSYYVNRDLDAISRVFNGDDAVIIWGNRGVSCDSTKTDSGSNGNAIREQYFDQLKHIFCSDLPLTVTLDHISIVKHDNRENVYGVTLHQSLMTQNYSDEGWLFLLWDFNKPEEPKIHIRTWQSDQDVDHDGVFDLNDFFIP